MIARATVLTAFAVAAAAPAVAQEAGSSGARTECERPAYSPNRQEEDWSALEDEECRTDPFDALKRVDVGAGARLTVGGSVRTQLEVYDDESFGDFPGADGSWHRRLMLHAGLDLGEHVRLFAELKHGGVEGKRFPVPASEEEDLDFNQAFLELRTGGSSDENQLNMLVRLGRQELHYGAGRLVSVRDGLNVRRGYDGALARLARAGWRADAFLVVPNADDKGVFDNGRLPGAAFWGVYATRSLPSGSLELYYLGDKRRGVTYQAADGRETRNTLGGRVAFKWGELTGDVEAAYQFGTLRAATDADIDAWTIASSVQLRLIPTGWQPSLGLEAGIASGDDDAGDRRLNTFRAPFPPGRYFGMSNPLGPSNILGVRPYLKLQPTSELTLTSQARLFWRASEADGLYSPPGRLLRPAGPGGRYVGTEPAVEVNYGVDRHLSLYAGYAHFFAGRSLREAGNGRDVDFVELRLEYVF